MRLIGPGLLASVLLASPANARQAHVYIADPQLAASRNIESISASDARLVFAHRLGLSEFHSLADEGLNFPVIEALNIHGGQHTKLFGSEIKTPSKSIIFIDGFDKAADILPVKLLSNSFRFSISHVPSFEATQKFFQDLREQYDFLAIQRSGSFAHSEATFKIMRKGHSGSDDKVRSRLGQLLEQDSNAIVVLTSPSTRGAFSTSPKGWGTYRSIQRRQLDFNSGRPDITPETSVDPLDMKVVPVEDSSFNSDVHDSTPILDWVDFPAETEDGDDDDTRNATAPRGILPQCFSTESNCKKMTNNCSGHGSCQSKFKYQEGTKTIECFACKCLATVKEHGASKLTTYWSGPACQKQDVSSAFWLLSGLTISLLLVVTWGIGLLYSMGQEELPSVIGAGVSGPRPKQ